MYEKTYYSFHHQVLISMPTKPGYSVPMSTHTHYSGHIIVYTQKHTTVYTSVYIQKNTPNGTHQKVHRKTHHTVHTDMYTVKQYSEP